MTLLAIGELHVQLFKSRLRLQQPLLQVLGQGFNVRQILVDLLRAALGLLSQLVQLQ